MMNKVMKNVLFCFIILLSVFFPITHVDANSIKNIDMDVYIDSNGNATVTEIWKAHLSKGTEGYKQYTRLGNSKISNFSVSDDSGRIYKFSPNLSLMDFDFDSKAYKNWFNSIPNGIELCWGISEYGNRTYILKYEISNFVTQYTDAQGIYFNLLNIDETVKNAKIIIHSDIPFYKKNSKIWAFGNNGSINFENGNIVLDSEGRLSSKQYMVALIKFQDNIFNTTNKSNSSFDSVYNSAFSDVNKPRQRNYVWMNIISVCIVFSFPLVSFGFVLWAKIKINKLIDKLTHSDQLNFGIYGKKLPRNNEINYCREIPCDKDLMRAYWLCSKYKIVSENKLKKGIIGAILLKWIKNGYVTVTKTKKNLFSFKDNNYAIDCTKMSQVNDVRENVLYQMLLSVPGYNKIVEAKQLSKWSKKNSYRIDSWFSNNIYEEEKRLKQQGLITETKMEIKRKFGRTEIKTIKNVNPKLKDEAIQLKGLKKFLLDYSTMPEKEYLEVNIWEEYLIFAQLLGIADKVEKQLNILLPDFDSQTLLNTATITVAIRSMTNDCYRGVQAGQRIESIKESFESSGSDGSGGSSYSSGGGSAGGSSGGGFR